MEIIPPIPRAFDWTLHGWKWEHGLYSEFGGSTYLSLGPVRLPIPESLEDTLRLFVALALLTGLLLAFRFLFLLLRQGRSSRRGDVVPRPALLPSLSPRHGVFRISLWVAGAFISLCLVDMLAGASSVGRRNTNRVVHLCVVSTGEFQISTVPVSASQLDSFLSTLKTRQNSDLLLQVHASRHTSTDDLSRLITLVRKHEPQQVWIVFDQEDWMEGARQKQR